MARGSVVPMFLAFLLWPHFSRAQERRSVFLEDLTSVEVQSLVQWNTTTIIVPIGGTEQNGPIMALGKHNVRVRFLSGKIAMALGNALVAPVVAYVPEGRIDPPRGHMRFAGTISIPYATFESLLESIARSFKAHGFRNIIFLGDHGGYQRSERQVADRLNHEWTATPVRAHAIEEYYRVTQTLYVQMLKERGYSPAEIGTHAGLADTSLMLAVDPGMVRTERLSSHAQASRAEGVLGDPTRSSAELGQLGVDAIITRTVAAIKTVTGQLRSDCDNFGRHASWAFFEAGQ